MLDTYDIGSLPLRVEESVIYEGARRQGSLLSLLGAQDESSEVFEEEVVSATVDKLRAGLTVPNYPQFRDMSEMFFELLRGIEKVEGGYVALREVTAKPGSSIPEVEVIRENVSRIRDEAGVDRLKLKVCVTGPYTLASFFQAKNARLFEELGHSLAEIVSRSVFDSRHGGVALVCIDEPVLGFLNDPLLDYGSEGRESLGAAWEEICSAASSKGSATSIHLHDTSDDLFWEVAHLDLVQAHIGDPLYSQDATSRRLEETGKRLKASIFHNQFDDLIEARLKREGVVDDVEQRVGDTWTQIRRGEVDPMVFLEEVDVGLARLRQVVKRFGVEKVPMVGPECGVGGWPSYETAMECLRRTAEATRLFEKEGL